MIDRSTTFGLDDSQTAADRVKAMLTSFYDELLERGIPDHLAALVQRLEDGAGKRPHLTQRLALIVESDDHVRAAACNALAETGLECVQCRSAEEALAVLRLRASETVFVFTAEDLAGPRDGIEFAKVAVLLWPALHFVLTTDGTHSDPPDLPEAVVRLRKPWLGLDLIREAQASMNDPARRLRRLPE